MADPSPQREPSPPADDLPEDSGGAVTTTAPTRTPRPSRTPPKQLPPWKVLLHNDDVNDMLFVVKTVMMLTPLGKEESIVRTLEAHESGTSLLLTTHQERAELYRDQFTSRGLTVTIEPA